MSDTTATLHALADHYRNLAYVMQGTELEVTARPGIALAALFDGIAQRHTHHTLHAFGDPAREVVLNYCDWCQIDDREDLGWPCPDAAAALAVAASLGISP